MGDQSTCRVILWNSARTGRAICCRISRSCVRDSLGLPLGFPEPCEDGSLALPLDLPEPCVNCSLSLPLDLPDLSVSDLPLVLPEPCADCSLTLPDDFPDPCTDASVAFPPDFPELCTEFSLAAFPAGFPVLGGVSPGLAAACGGGGGPVSPPAIPPLNLLLLVPLLDCSGAELRIRSARRLNGRMTALWAGCGADREGCRARAGGGGRPPPTERCPGDGGRLETVRGARGGGGGGTVRPATPGGKVAPLPLPRSHHTPAFSGAAVHHAAAPD